MNKLNTSLSAAAVICLATSMMACSHPADDPELRSACIAVRAGGSDVTAFGYPFSVYLDGLKNNGGEVSWEPSENGGILRAKRHDALTGKDFEGSFELLRTTASRPSDRCGPAQVVFTRYVDSEGNAFDGFALQTLILTTVTNFAEVQHQLRPLFPGEGQTQAKAAISNEAASGEQALATDSVPQGPSPHGTSAPDPHLATPTTGAADAEQSASQSKPAGANATDDPERARQVARTNRDRQEAQCREDYDRVYAHYIAAPDAERGSAVTAEQVRMNACMRALGPVDGSDG